MPWIEGDVSSTPDVSMELLEAMVDVNVTAELANGKVYVLTGGLAAEKKPVGHPHVHGGWRCRPSGQRTGRLGLSCGRPRGAPLFRAPIASSASSPHVPRRNLICLTAVERRREEL